jgi:hypothetical protein
MKKQSYRLLLVLGWTLAGCAPSQTRVENTYQNPLLADRAYAKVLVVGVTENADRRRTFENDVVRSFADMEVGAVSALTQLGSAQALNREVLAAAARDTGSDAVLITRLVDSQARAEVEEGRATASAERRNDVALADFFRYDYVEYRDPMTVTTVLTVVVASDLYDVATETRVWSAQSTAFEKNSVDAAIEEVAEAVTQSLRSGGWLD